MTPLFLVITENKAFAQLCRKALTNAGFQSSKLASACLSNGRKASLPFLPTMFFSTAIAKTIWTTTS